MRPVIIKQVGVGTSTLAVMDVKQAPFNVGLGAVITNSPTYNIEHTFDNVQDSTITPTWFQLWTGLVANKDTNYSAPVRAIRINVTAVAGSGTVTATIIQSNRR